MRSDPDSQWSQTAPSFPLAPGSKLTWGIEMMHDKYRSFASFGDPLEKYRFTDYGIKAPVTILFCLSKHPFVLTYSLTLIV